MIWLGSLDVWRRVGTHKARRGGWDAYGESIWTNGDKTRPWSALINRSTWGYALDLTPISHMHAAKPKKWR